MTSFPKQKVIFTVFASNCTVRLMFMRSQWMSREQGWSSRLMKKRRSMIKKTRTMKGTKRKIRKKREMVDPESVRLVLAKRKPKRAKQPLKQKMVQMNKQKKIKAIYSKGQIRYFRSATPLRKHWTKLMRWSISMSRQFLCTMVSLKSLLRRSVEASSQAQLEHTNKIKLNVNKQRLIKPLLSKKQPLQNSKTNLLIKK